MRTLATIALVSSGWVCFAAEPAVVSVHPAVPAAKPEMKNVVTGTLVLEGTLVPAGETVGMTVAAPTTPTVPMPELKCGTPMFGGSMLASGCDLCESKGRPALFGSLFTKPFLLFGNDCGTCQSCPAPKCDSAKCPTPTTCGTGCGGGGRWERFKSWMTWAPCDGPRIPFIQFEPYLPTNFTAMRCLPQNHGTCHDNACSGRVRGLGLGLGKPGCDTGNCGTGRFGLHAKKGPQDCNAAEPKLSGAGLIDGYRFAHIEPKVYGRATTHIDPIAGIVKASDVDKKPTAIEQASAIVPAKGPKGLPLPAVRESSKPLATPFSNP
jgi:hypothetical protein